jgi:demethylmenaquinone methyltransferase/2-methoxy-6-polyprenyl-1,4-benzoquinol methylase
VKEPAAWSEENTFAANLFAGLPDRYDLLAELLSFGQNGRWRRALVERIVAAEPHRVLDVATGTGGVAIALARRTHADIIGVDLSEAMLDRGRRRVRAVGLDGRIELRTGRAEELPFQNAAFDAVSFTYLLRYVRDPVATLAEMARVLRPGGVLAGLDFCVPPNPFWRLGWSAYTRLGLPLAGGLLGGRPWLEVGRFLGPNISAHHRTWPPSRLRDAWSAVGLVKVETSLMSNGGGLVMWGRKQHA